VRIYVTQQKICAIFRSLTEEVSSIVVGSLVDALDGQRSFLQRTSVLPHCLAGRRLQDGDTVRQRRSVNSVALNATSEANLAFSLAADLVTEEGARLQQVVA